MSALAEGLRRRGEGLRAIAHLLPVVWLGVVGCSGGDSSDGQGSGGASTAEAFVDYWTDGSEWCENEAACGISTEQECLDGFDSPGNVRAAVEHANLDAAALDRCEESTRALDRCYFALPCDEWASEDPVCEAADERFQIDCAGLLTALQVDVTTSETSGGGSVATVGANTVGEALCNKSEECDGATLSASERSECESAIGEVFGVVVPDLGAAARCLEQTPCAAYEADFEAVVRDCIDVDPAQTSCEGTEGLHLCDSNGTCTDFDCSDACALIGATSVGCGFDDLDGYDNCQCQL